MYPYILDYYHLTTIEIVKYQILQKLLVLLNLCNIFILQHFVNNVSPTHYMSC